jgi:hypothetical protein
MPYYQWPRHEDGSLKSYLTGMTNDEAEAHLKWARRSARVEVAVIVLLVVPAIFAVFCFLATL